MSTTLSRSSFKCQLQPLYATYITQMLYTVYGWPKSPSSEQKLHAARKAVRALYIIPAWMSPYDITVIMTGTLKYFEHYPHGLYSVRVCVCVRELNGLRRNIIINIITCLYIAVWLSLWSWLCIAYHGHSTVTRTSYDLTLNNSIYLK